MSMSSTSTITNISSNQKTNHNNNHTHRISNGAQACAACKYQRRKCAPDCILAPYFPHDRQRQFQSDVRAKDPVGGCYRIAQRLQSDIYYATQQLDFVLQQIAMCRAHQAAYQQQQQQPHHHNNDDPTTTSSYEIQQLHENEDEVGGGEVLNHHHPPQDHAIQDFQYSWNLQDSVWIPSKGSSNREGSSPVEGDHDLCRDIKPETDHGVNLGHEYVEITSFERGESFKFDQQAIEKSEMILKAENLALDDEEAFQQHQIPEHDLRSAATLFTLTS